MDQNKPNLESPGAGNVGWQGMGFQAIDLGHEIFPEDGVDFIMVPRDGLQALGKAWVPKGAMIVFIEPAVAAQLRVQFKAASGHPLLHHPPTPKIVA